MATRQSGSMRSVCYTYSNRNGQVHQSVMTESQLPGQSPIRNYYTGGDQSFDFDEIRRRFFSDFPGFTSRRTRLLDDFFGASLLSSFSPFQSQISYTEPKVEELSDEKEYSSYLNTTKKPEVIEFPEEEEWEVWEDKDEEKEKDEMVEIIDEEENHQREDEELREIYRSSYLSLPIERNKKAGKYDVKVMVKLPNGKRVENVFNEDDHWGMVKQWVSYEMAIEKSIRNNDFLLENEYELAISNPFTIVTNAEESGLIVRRIAEFSDRLGKRLNLIIHRTR